MKHDYHDREDGLAHCKVCNGGEASLPTDCPGKRMAEWQDNAVQAGKIDYKGGRWIILPQKPNQSRATSGD